MLIKTRFKYYTCLLKQQYKTTNYRNGFRKMRFKHSTPTVLDDDQKVGFLISFIAACYIAISFCQIPSDYYLAYYFSILPYKNVDARFFFYIGSFGLWFFTLWRVLNPKTVKMKIRWLINFHTFAWGLYVFISCNCFKILYEYLGFWHYKTMFFIHLPILAGITAFLYFLYLMFRDD